MQIKLKRITIFLLIILMSLAVVGCDNLVTQIETTEQSTAVQTTIGDTTALTAQEQTTVDTTTQTTTQQTTQTTTNTEYLHIEVTDIQQSEYEMGSEFNHDTITVLFIREDGTNTVLNNTIYTLIGFNSGVAGEQTLTVSYATFSTTFTVTIINTSGGLEITMPYYSGIYGLLGSALLDELHFIINSGFQGVTYGEARYILDETDADPTDPSKLILIYLGTSISNVWDYGVTWNREHVWPQSLLPGSAANDTVNTCSDLQNLKPADPGTNSSRGNRYYANQTVGGLSYCPRDEVKGDVARILLYMITMYDELSLVDTEPNYLEMGLFSVLLDWHELDPVDDFERNRNDIIYSYQYNRNPYIDYPELVDMIWG